MQTRVGMIKQMETLTLGPVREAALYWYGTTQHGCGGSLLLDRC